MKKTVFIVLLTFLCAGVTIAQKKTIIKKHAVVRVVVPEVVSTSLKEKFTVDVSPVWSKSATGNYVAAFDNNGSKQIAEFSPEGKWISTSTMIAFEQLTEVAQKNIRDQYVEMQIAEVKKIERDGMSAFYKVKLIKDKDNKTVYVNDAGFVKE